MLGEPTTERIQRKPHLDILDLKKKLKKKERKHLKSRENLINTGKLYDSGLHQKQ